MPTADKTPKANAIATIVADRCHGNRKKGQAPALINPPHPRRPQMVNDDDRAAGMAFIMARKTFELGGKDHHDLMQLLATHRAQAIAELVGVLEWLCEQMEREQAIGVSGFEDWITPACALLRKHGEE